MMASSVGRGFLGRNSLRKDEVFWGYVLLAPTIAYFALFAYYPIIFALFVSFNEYDLFTGKFSWRGLSNYLDVFRDPVNLRAISNTLIYTGGVVLTGTFVGLIVAIVLDRLGGWTSNLYSLIFYMPLIVSVVAISRLWLWIYDNHYGLLNQVLLLVGLRPISWLTSPDTALLSVMLMSTWRGMGYSMVIFLAGLKNVPESLYEAAKVDGASSFQTVVRVTIPLLTPIILLALVVNTMNSFKVFAQVLIMSSGVTTRGGPLDSTLTIVLQIYQLSFVDFRIGVGQALAFVLTAAVLLITYVQRRFFARFDFRY